MTRSVGAREGAATLAPLSANRNGVLCLFGYAEAVSGARVERPAAALECAGGGLDGRPLGGQPVLGLAHEGAQLVQHDCGRGIRQVQGLDAIKPFEDSAGFLHASTVARGM